VLTQDETTIFYMKQAIPQDTKHLAVHISGAQIRVMLPLQE
jgi:hypothetical protein